MDDNVADGELDDSGGGGGGGGLGLETDPVTAETNNPVPSPAAILPAAQASHSVFSLSSSSSSSSSSSFPKVDLSGSDNLSKKAALMQALVGNDRERVLKFVQSEMGRSDLDFSPLHVIIENERLELLEFLLQNGVDPNRKWKIYILGETPVHMAIHCSNVKAVEILLNNGASQSITDSYGRTPLMMAALRSDPDAVERIFDLLLRRLTEKEVNRVDYGEKVSALNYVIRNINLVDRKFVRKLLEHGASPNVQNKRLHRTPLMEAIVFRSHEYVKDLTRIFMQHHFDPHLQDVAGSTALHLLSEWGFSAATRELLQYEKVNINRQNHRGQTALWLAVFYNHVEIVLILTVAGCDMTIRNFPDAIHHPLPKSPFMVAVELGHYEIARLLVQTGFNPYYEYGFRIGSLPPAHRAVHLKTLEWIRLSTKNPKSLQHLARLAVRDIVVQAPGGGLVTPYRIARLPLPTRLLAYLLFNDLPPTPSKKTRRNSGFHQQNLIHFLN